MLNLDLSKIEDYYTRSIFRQVLTTLNSVKFNKDIHKYIESKTINGEEPKVTAGSAVVSALVNKPSKGSVCVYKNGTRLGLSQYKVNYDSGVITLSAALVAGDIVIVDYLIE